MSENDRARHRLTPADRSQELLPWRRATQLADCCLYWAPVSSKPMPAAQRLWLMTFLDRFSKGVAGKQGLRAEVFLQMKLLYPMLMEDFTNYSLETPPIPGLLRRSGAGIPKAPNEDDIQAILEGRKKYKFDDYMPDLAYWFVKKQPQKQLELFFGHGGMLMIYMKPDPKTTAPKLMISKKVREQLPVFKMFDVDAIHEATFSMLDAFQDKSKELFGKGLESHSVYKGLRFIIPLLETKDFFQQPEEERKKWFELFGIYFIESLKDKGVLLALKTEVDEELIEIIKQMRSEGLQYPE